MAAELGIQRLLLFAHRVVPVLFAPVVDRLYPSAETFGERLHVHCELAMSATGADVREAEESEGLRFLALSPRIPCCIAPEFNQPGLLRVQGQAVLFKTLGQYLQHSFRILLVLKTQDGIIGETNLVSFPFQPGLPHALEPFIEPVMQVDVGQKRTDWLPLSRPCFAFE